MKQPGVEQYRNDLASRLSSESDKNKRREILNEARQNPKYDEARSKTMENRILETYFNETFFPKVWPKLIGEEGRVDIGVKESSGVVGKKLWDSMVPSLDLYAKKFELPQGKKDGESDQEFFKRLVDKMYGLNQKNKEHWDAWPAKALEDGATNCSMGSQIAFRVLEKAGFAVEYCMPGPLTHATVIAKTEGGQGYYLDQANGVVIPVKGEKDIDGIKAYEIETDDPRVPFRLVPVFPIEKSVATQIWNLDSLISKALQERSDEVLVSLVKRFGLEPKINYGKWARDHIFPEAGDLSKQEIWKREKDESSKRIAAP